MSNVLLVKLAAIGDVTMTCQALRRHAQSIRQAGWQLHWVIDQGLQNLANSLLERSGISVTFHPIDSKRLFQGGLSGKLAASANLYSLTKRLNPSTMVLMHRDRRYRLLLSTASMAPLFMLEQNSAHELENQESTLVQALRESGVPAQLHVAPRSLADSSLALKISPPSRVGILVGGAQNQKTYYKEKAWPYFPRLVQMIVNQTEAKVTLFGAATDQPVAHEILSTLASDKREKVNDLVGKLSLDQVPAQIAKQDAFVGVDSGLVHIAAHVLESNSCRILALFGPTDPKVWGPRASGAAQIEVLSTKKGCSPCYKDDGVFETCHYKGEQFRNCMNDLSPETVFHRLGF